MVPLKIVSNVSRFKPALNLNRVLADLNRGSNSLNSISELSPMADQYTGHASPPVSRDHFTALPLMEFLVKQ